VEVKFVAEGADDRCGTRQDDRGTELGWLGHVSARWGGKSVLQIGSRWWRGGICPRRGRISVMKSQHGSQAFEQARGAGRAG
jgi:hypothetical protein